LAAAKNSSTFLSLAQLYASDINLSRRRSEKRLHRRLEPQNFLECQTY